MSHLVLLQGNAQHLPLTDGSMHCCVTSPPYWGLRDYGVAGQLGLEALHDCHGAFTGQACGNCYICHMRAVFAEVWRVLRDDGTLWLNIGDTYNAKPGQRSTTDTVGSKQQTNSGSVTIGSRHVTVLKPKDLCGIPWRLAFALQADGWYLRSEIIWHKPNPMPESVTDRPTKSHEQVFLLTKRERYFYDAEAIREEGSPNTHARFGNGGGARQLDTKWTSSHGLSKPNNWCLAQVIGRNARTVWTIPSEPTHEAHFATFPRALAHQCILAGTSAYGCCQDCGSPFVRQVDRQRLLDGSIPVTGTFSRHDGPFRIFSNGIGHSRYSTRITEVGWQASCACIPQPPAPCRILDPFCGSGTTVFVARELGRESVGIDLSFPYLHDIARTRLSLDKLAAWEGGNGNRQSITTYKGLPLFGATL